MIPAESHHLLCFYHSDGFQLLGDQSRFVSISSAAVSGTAHSLPIVALHIVIDAVYVCYTLSFAAKESEFLSHREQAFRRGCCAVQL